MVVIAAVALAAAALLGVWWCIFSLNREDRMREESFDFPDRDDTRMWEEIRHALARPTEGEL